MKLVHLGRIVYVERNQHLWFRLAQIQREVVCSHVQVLKLLQVDHGEYRKRYHRYQHKACNVSRDSLALPLNAQQSSGPAAQHDIRLSLQQANKPRTCFKYRKKVVDSISGATAEH
jgi:hypothetical protein